MAGGVKKPVNIFKLKDLGEPAGAFNWRLWFAVVSFALLGAALPWYKIGLHGNKNAEELDQARDEKHRYAEESHATGIELEHQRKQEA